MQGEAGSGDVLLRCEHTEGALTPMRCTLLFGRTGNYAICDSVCLFVFQDLNITKDLSHRRCPQAFSTLTTANVCS